MEIFGALLKGELLELLPWPIPRIRRLDLGKDTQSVQSTRLKLFNSHVPFWWFVVARKMEVNGAGTGRDGRRTS